VTRRLAAASFLMYRWKARYGGMELSETQRPFVRGVERLSDFFRDAQCLADPQTPPAQPPLEGLAADVLHRDARAIV
jgi:hypothetical protein